MGNIALALLGRVTAEMALLTCCVTMLIQVLLHKQKCQRVWITEVSHSSQAVEKQLLTPGKSVRYTDNGMLSLSEANYTLTASGRPVKIGSWLVAASIRYDMMNDSVVNALQAFRQSEFQGVWMEVKNLGAQIRFW